MKHIVSSLVIITIVYMNISGWFWELDPAKWPIWGRILLTFICLLCSIIYTAEDEKEENEEEHDTSGKA